MYTKIHDSIWSSLKRKKLSDTGKILYTYLLSCSHRNMIGLYYLPYAYAAADLDWSMDRVSKGFSELCAKCLIRYDDGYEMVFVSHFLEFNPLDNPKVESKASKVFEELPDSSVILDFMRDLEELPKRYQTLIDTVSKRYAIQETETETEKETEKETEEETEEEVYCSELSADADPSELEPATSKEPIITLTLNDKSEYPIYQDQVRRNK